MEIIDTVIAIISKVCEIDPTEILPQGKLVGYHIDSVSMLEILEIIEDTFDIEINEMDCRLRDIQTIEDFVKYVENRVQENAA